MFDVLKGSAIYDELDVTMREAMQIARRPTRGAVKGEVPSDHRLEDRFLYVPSSAVRSYAPKSEALDDLFQAVAELRVLRFRYRQSQSERQRVVAHPYALLLHGGAVITVARDVDREETRVFALDRIEDTQPSEEERFRLPASFDLGTYLHGVFGVRVPLPGARHVRVLVEFDAKAAEEIRLQRFHPTQKIATSPDGRVRVSMSLVSLEGVRAWVLGLAAPPA